MSSLQTSSSWISKNVIDWTCDEIQEWVASTDVPPTNAEQIIQTIHKQNTCGRIIYAAKINSFPGANDRYGTHLYKALQTIKEENDDILPAKFKRVNKKRGILQANLPKAKKRGILPAKFKHVNKKCVYNSKLRPISRKIDKRSIVKCIGEVIIRPTKAATDVDKMVTGTGTAFRKLDHGYIAILTSAQNVIGDDSEPHS
eukprot:32526_1